MAEPEIADDPAIRQFVENTEEGAKLRVIQSSTTRQVDLRDPLEFEDELLSDITAPVQFREGIGSSIPVKGPWIHGWLQHKGEDYINNIYKNWLHFTTYVRARTKQFINTQTYSIRPGSYESMYRYILILEDLGLVDRIRREEVDQDEYDHFVPDNMRNRTYVAITTPMEEAEEQWLRPHDHAYPDGELPEERKPPESEEEESAEIEIEEEEEPEEAEEESESAGGGLESFGEPGEEETPEATEAETEGLDELSSSEGFAGYPEEDKLEDIIEEGFSEAMEQAFRDTSIPVPDVEPFDFSLGRIAIFGEWIDGEPVKGETPLKLYITVDAQMASREPGFIPAGFANNMQTMLGTDPRFGEWFTEFIVTSTYDSEFRTRIRDIVQREQEEDVYYDLQRHEMVEI